MNVPNTSKPTKKRREIDWEILIVRVAMSLVGACVLMLIAAFIGGAVAPNATGWPVAITGAITGTVGFLAVWIFDPLENW